MESSIIRKEAIIRNIPFVTTLSGAEATVYAIERLKSGHLTVKSIQEYHQRVLKDKVLLSPWERLMSKISVSILETILIRALNIAIIIGVSYFILLISEKLIRKILTWGGKYTRSTRTGSSS